MGIGEYGGYCLKSASEELKNDQNVAITAIAKDGMNLEYVGKQIKNDTNIVL